jgi:endoglucanase
MAIHAKLENAIIHHDVIDAIFRQPFTDATKPFKANKIGNGTIINAVDYDLGRNGSAYFDTDTADYHTSGKPSVGNRGRIYRNDGVDISKDSTAYNSFYVDHIESGEWLQYTIQVKTAGVYSISLKVASGIDDAKLSINVNGTDQAKEVAIPKTEGLKTWKTIAVKDIRLKAGSNKVRVYANKGGYNLHWLQFWKGSRE